LIDTCFAHDEAGASPAVAALDATDAPSRLQVAGASLDDAAASRDDGYARAHDVGAEVHDDAANASYIEAVCATTSSFIYETKNSCHQKWTSGTPDASTTFGRTIAG
jgi:hypothetical protein